jgi:tetratricopeptide (TPR) repeat protein
MDVPVHALLSGLVDPEAAFVGPASPNAGESAAYSCAEEDRELARRLYAAGDLAALADLYQRESERAWRDRAAAACLRLLHAERVTALRSGDEVRASLTTMYLAERHRLSSGFVPAEALDRALLSQPPTPDTARFHAIAWREIGAIKEVARAYDEGLAAHAESIAVCLRFAGASGTAKTHVQTLLARSSLHRVRGFPADALRDVREAAALAAALPDEPHISGLIALREGGVHLVVGDAEAALRAYRLAQELFRGVSSVNEEIALLRQVACLRGLDNGIEALEVADGLVEHFETAGDGYRLGQVLLEKAEVLQDLGYTEGVTETLERLRPIYEHADSLEALRWHRHVARNLIEIGADQELAAGHLRLVLERAADDDRRDLTRTLLGLFDVLRLAGMEAVDDALRLAVSRAAVVAAELQRDALDRPQSRWAMHGQREAVYFEAVRIHHALGDHGSAAQIMEAGRADVLNTVLTSGARPRPARLADLPMIQRPPDAAVADDLYEAARAAAAALGPARPRLPCPVLALPGPLPEPAMLDRLARRIVTVQIALDDYGRWWSYVAYRRPGTTWQVEARQAPPVVGAVFERLVAGGELAPRGMRTSTLEALGSVLLPHDEIWQGEQGAVPLLLCPDPRLWQIPYAALRRDGVRLADVAETTMTPSLRTTLVLLRRAAETAARPGIGPAATILDASLPGHDATVDALRTWPGGTRPIESLDELGAHAACGLLYIGAHGSTFGDDGELLGTGIALHNLADASLPKLVVLCSCWSGAAASRYGRDPLSLAVGALLGGADTVIAGAGPIGMLASARIAAATLEAVRHGDAPARALREAQLRFVRENEGTNIFEWAGLRVVGLG